MTTYHSPLGFDYTEREFCFYLKAIQEARDFFKKYGKGRTPQNLVADTKAYDGYSSTKIVPKPTTKTK